MKSLIVGCLLAAMAGACIAVAMWRAKPMADYHKKRDWKLWPKEPEDATEDELKIVADFCILLGLAVIILIYAIVAT